MIDKMFYKKAPFVYDYFTNLLNLVKENKRNFPQAIVFEGMDTKLQYLFSLELARNLNCIKDGNKDCDCINCRWIKNIEHPGINNVSQIHFKPEGDETKTVISVKQAGLIEKTLTLSSDYYRFFIFFSSKECEIEEQKDFLEFGIEKDIDFTIEPLNRNTFNPNAINALLKSVEEPPSNTCFVFLTKSKEDILQTIVSRCQVFKLGKDIQKIDYTKILDIIPNYFEISIENAFDISANMLEKIKQENSDCGKYLNIFLEYLKELVKQNAENSAIYQKLNYDIKLTSLAIKQIKASMQDRIVLDSLFLSIAKGYTDE